MLYEHVWRRAKAAAAATNLRPEVGRHNQRVREEVSATREDSRWHTVVESRFARCAAVAVLDGLAGRRIGESP